MKKKHLVLGNYDFVFLIDNNYIEIYNTHTQVYKKTNLTGKITNRLVEIEEFLEPYKNEKKIIITGEPIIFYKENYSKNSKHHILYDDYDLKYYYTENKKNLKESFESKKYYKKNFFRYFKNNTLFLDLFEIMLSGFDDNSCVVAYNHIAEPGIYKIIGNYKYSKMNIKDFLFLLNAPVPINLFSYTETNIPEIKLMFEKDKYEYLSKYIIENRINTFSNKSIFFEEMKKKHFYEKTILMILYLFLSLATIITLDFITHEIFKNDNSYGIFKEKLISKIYKIKRMSSNDMKTLLKEDEHIKSYFISENIASVLSFFSTFDVKSVKLDYENQLIILTLLEIPDNYILSKAYEYKINNEDRSCIIKITTSEFINFKKSEVPSLYGN